MLDAALVLVDRDGQAALTMRALGRELGVEAMSLYRYFPGKETLLDALVQRVHELGVLIGPVQHPWQTELRRYAWARRAALLEHPEVVLLSLSRPPRTIGALAGVQRGVRVLAASGIPVRQAAEMMDGLAALVTGHVASQVLTSSRSTDGAPVEPPPDRTTHLPPVTVHRCAPRPASDHRGFGFAVDALLTGYGQCVQDGCL